MPDSTPRIARTDTPEGPCAVLAGRWGAADLGERAHWRALQPQLAAVTSIYTEYANEIVRGVRPVDDFAEMVEKFNAAGGDALTEYVNSVLQ